MAFFGQAAAAAATTTASNVDKDIEVSDPPTDSISCLSFSNATAGDYLAVGAWDNNVRIYEVGPSGQTQGKAMYSHEGPVLDVCWNGRDGSKLFSVGADKAVRMFDVSTGQSSQVGVHEAPIKCARWIESPTGGILATGSWDKTVKYWDLRSPNPVSTVQVQERVYTMDVQYPLMVVGTAERQLQILNLNNPTTVFKTMASPLKWQTRVVACFPGANGFAIGSVEGRVAIQYIDEKDASSNFSFKCHRHEQSPGAKETQLVYSVNAITFHHQHGTFSTAGSDGTINFWDKDSKTRLKTFEKQPAAITATAFNKTGQIFAYSIAYDWSKGYSGMQAGHPNKILLHACKDEEIKRKPRK